MKTVWLWLSEDPHQYQGRADVRGVYVSEAAATAAMEAQEYDIGDVMWVEEYDVEGGE